MAVIGIDFGTSSSCAALWENESVTIIPNEFGECSTPSCVSFSEEGILVGERAKHQRMENPDKTIFGVKRLLGRRFNDTTDLSLLEDVNRLPYAVEGEGVGVEIKIQIDGKNRHFHPQEVAAMILRKMVCTAEIFTKKSVEQAVITVPAYFNDSQRQCILDAGKIAGFDVLQILNDSTAVAISYELGMFKDNNLYWNNKEEYNILVFDIGGGFLDVSIVAIEDAIFEVVAVAGDTHLGGEDFDNLLIDYCVSLFKQRHNLEESINIDLRAMQRLRIQCEEAKCILSSEEEASIVVENLLEGYDFREILTRAKFEEICNKLFETCVFLLKRVLIDAKLAKSDIEEVILVGGCSRIPKVKTLVCDFFNNREPVTIVNPAGAAASGAAVIAASLSGKLKDDRDPIVVDVAAHSLGYEVAGGCQRTLLDRNCAIPRAPSIMLNITRVPIHLCIKVYEGERQFARDNRLLGYFRPKSWFPAASDDPKIRVYFKVDNNGILSLTADDETLRYSESEIQKMCKILHTLLEKYCVFTIETAQIIVDYVQDMMKAPTPISLDADKLLLHPDLVCRLGKEFESEFDNIL